MTALAETETADIMAAAFSGIGDKGYQGSGFITPFKKPQGGELLDWQKEFNAQVNRLRAPVERAIAHLKSWRILHTDYRRPLRTYATSYQAAVGLYFFKLNFRISFLVHMFPADGRRPDVLGGTGSDCAGWPPF